MKTKLNFLTFLFIVILLVSCEREAKEWGTSVTYSSPTELKIKIAENTSLEYGVDIDTGIDAIYQYGTLKSSPNAKLSFCGPLKAFPGKLAFVYEPNINFIGIDTLEFSYIVKEGNDVDKPEGIILRFIVEVEDKDVHDYSSDIFVTIQDHAPYNYFLGLNIFPKEYEIITPSSHASTCEIKKMDNYSEIYFCYTPEEGFKGKDYIEVMSYDVGDETNSSSEKRIYNKYCFTIEVE